MRKGTSKGKDVSHLPEADSSCRGEYGPDKKRKDGSFLLREDYGMHGIAHIPLTSSCEPICAGPHYHEEKHRCTSTVNSCNCSRVFCCNTTMCNSEKEMSEGTYHGAPYDEWMTRLEHSLRKKRDAVFNATDAGVKSYSSNLLLLLLL